MRYPMLAAAALVAALPAAAQTAPDRIVYFAWDKSDLDPEALATLDALADALAARPYRAVSVEGHLDRSQSPDYALALSDRMAGAVRAYLEARGVPAAKITTRAYGVSRPQVDTVDGVREPLNRRVEIRVAWN